MDDVVKKAIERLVDDLAERDGTDDFEVAGEVVRSAGLDVVFELAAAALVGGARAKRRRETLVAERASTRDLTAQMSESEKMARSVRQAQWDEEDAQARAERWNGLAKIISDYTDQMRVVWDAELLASSFSLSDGTRITWADATVEQHRERATMFESNAIANAEGAARHRRAILDLQENGAETLGAMVGVAA